MVLRSKMERVKARMAMQERVCMSDAAAFLGSYKKALSEQVTSGGIWPRELAQIYAPESCLKHSGAKEVYLVIDKRTGARVVLRASDLDADERADVEHVILSRLNYPGIPKTYGTFVKNGRSYIAREYFEGEPLDQVIARGLMEPPQIYQIARQICSLLGYPHSQTPPVIHRDIKPQNIIMRTDGSVGLTDFGIARTFKEGSDSDTQYMGTLLYAPPEQYGYSQSSPQTDIYALGIVLIYLATGSADRRHLDRRINDAGLRALIEKCIAFDPKNRFQNVNQVIKRIDSVKTRRARVIGGIVATSCLAVTLIAGATWFVLSGTLNSMLSGADQTSSAVQGYLVTPNALLGAITEKNYPASEDPTIGSTAWLFDFNNDGNLPGNINNGGFAVEDISSKRIYAACGDAIYSFGYDGKVISRIAEGSNPHSLNIEGDYLYYIDDKGIIYKHNLANGEETTIDSFSAERLYFSDRRLLATNTSDSLYLYDVKTDGSGATPVSGINNAHYSNIVDGIRYYSDGADGFRIYAQNLETGERALIYNSPAHWLSVWNGRIYFSDDREECMASISLSGENFRIEYENPCYYLSASNHGIFAVDAVTKYLIVVESGTGEMKVVRTSGTSYFSVAGGWIFYKNSHSSDVAGMIREDGTENCKLILEPPTEP